jgi:transcriptional regulator with XRE-family HTH domain
VLPSDVLAVSTAVVSPAPRWYVRPDAGQVLREARKRRGLTQKDLGLILGQPLERAQSYVSKLEAGQLGYEAVDNAAYALQLSRPEVMELRSPL